MYNPTQYQTPYNAPFRLQQVRPFNETEHIGRWFKREVFEYHEFKAKDVAAASGISETKLSKFLNEKIDLDNDLAIRLAHTFKLSARDLVMNFALYKLNIDLLKHQRDNAIFNYSAQQIPPKSQQDDSGK